MPPNEVISVETRTERQILALILQHGRSSFWLNLLASLGLAAGAMGEAQAGPIHPILWLIGVVLATAPLHIMAIPHLKTMDFMEDADRPDLG